MVCYLYKRGCHKWRACVGDELAWVVCLFLWRASVGEVPVWVTCQGGLRGQCARVTCHRDGAPTQVKWAVRQSRWHGWHTKVSSVGDIGGNTRMMCQTYRGWMLFNARKIIRVSGQFLEFPLGILIQSYFKVPEQIQNSGMFRTRGVLRTFSIYRPKLQHIKIRDTCKILIY